MELVEKKRVQLPFSLFFLFFDYFFSASSQMVGSGPTHRPRCKVRKCVYRSSYGAN